jgi:hypothetical protein
MPILLPENYGSATVAQLLDAAAEGTVPKDRRWINALLASEEAGSQIVRYWQNSSPEFKLAIEGDVVSLLDWLNPPGTPEILVEIAKTNEGEFDDELMNSLIRQGSALVDPALKLMAELEEEQQGDLALVLSGLGVKDPRILQALLDHFEYSASDGVIPLGLYGDPAAIPKLEAIVGDLDPKDPEDQRLKGEIEEAIENIRTHQPSELPPTDPRDLYEEFELPDFELFEIPELGEVLQNSVDADYRRLAAEALFDKGYDEATVDILMTASEKDADESVRRQAVASLSPAAENKRVRQFLQAILFDDSKSAGMRAAAAVALANDFPEMDQEAYSKAVLAAYSDPEARAQAMEAMWRTLDKRFVEYGPQHLDDADVEIQKSAIMICGYLNAKSVAKKIEGFFMNSDLRESALFAYPLLMVTEVSRGRAKQMLRMVDKLANLNEEETGIVESAIDTRLMLHGLEPAFQQPAEE